MHFLRLRVPVLSVVAFVLAFSSCQNHNSGPARVLVFSKTMGYHHESIAEGNKAIMKMGAENGFAVDTANNSELFNEDSLKHYAAVVFLSTTGDVLNANQEAAFERYIQAGGGYVGIHAAADCEYDWGWYGRLAGAYFISHPGINDTFPNVQKGTFHVMDKTNAATSMLPDPWTRTDEFYNFKKISKDIHVLLTIDEKSYHGGINGDTHPMAWYHDYDGGRAFYTNLGHTNETYAEEPFLKHLLGGIKYAIGGNKALDYSKAKTGIPPEDNRFTKVQLMQGTFYEPTEMTVLPNLDILVIQRRGEIMLYKHETGKVKQVGFFDVYYKTLHTPGVNAEEGMLGLSKDPDYSKNNRVYIYYSPADSSVNRLSRFEFKNDTIDKKTEKVIIEVKAQREICCHTGGSIAFGPDKLLYFSAGDNSTPFNETGVKYVSNSYAPQNDIPGHQQFDARRSAGNTNDLRGKIMRLKINEDGSYEIPEGNLFPKGTANTRPEIYVMGDRNPYRISVDQKNSFLYWGEVGPDARADSMSTRGPKGYDEVNQARKAGFFGWPFFVGNNYPYREYDYATGKSGAAYDPAHPVNNSRNNTGLKDLPPAQPAFIWYPYDASPDFPQVGTGGRNAMAGPVYYTDLYPAATRYPDYFNNKLIVYDWMRGWIKAVTMLPNGDFDKMEPFFGSVKLNSMIDLEVGPDGRFYCLEYGSGWFQKNPDAGLARIDFNAGNRPPVVAGLTVDHSSGILPFAIKAKVDATDLEKDPVTYEWDFGNGQKKETKEPTTDYSYSSAGDFQVSVTVKDDKGASSKSQSVPVYAGNEAPLVTIGFSGGNKSFYMPGVPVHYAVTATDKTDPTAIDPKDIFVSVDYPVGFDKAAMGHQQGALMSNGQAMTLSMDCKSCHKEADKSVGPAFIDVAKKYAKDEHAPAYLANKIIKGGSGVWGQVAMAAHPGLSAESASEIVHWILSLGATADKKKSLPAEGNIMPPVREKPAAGASPFSAKPAPALQLTATYTDKGGANARPLTGNATATLVSNQMTFSGKEKVKGFNPFKYNGTTIMLVPAKEGSIETEAFDLSGVKAISLGCGFQVAPPTGFTIEAHLDQAEGKLLGKAEYTPQKGQPFSVLRIPLDAVSDDQLHPVVLVYKAPGAYTGGLVSISFDGK